ncbi:MAG: hypothetical protein ACR2PG_15310 [Hyphomicrobiaceae bacterium]
MMRSTIIYLSMFLIPIFTTFAASSATLTGPQGALTVQGAGTTGFNPVTSVPTTVAPGDLVSVAVNQPQPGIVTYDNGCAVQVPPGTVYPVQEEVNCDQAAVFPIELAVGLGLVGIGVGVFIFNSNNSDAPPPLPSSP